MQSDKKVEELILKACEALNNFATEKAIKAGKKLKKLKNTSAIEILALAYH